MFDREEFEKTRRESAAKQADDADLADVARDFIIGSDRHGYGYQWNWLGLPIIQMPSDIVAVQEVIWETQPDVIIETGIAWGGSVVLYASILELIGNGRVVAVDTVLPDNNVSAIMRYPFSSRITLLEGSSIDPEVAGRVKACIRDDDKVMVLLDSNHTHDHVLEELRIYAPLVTPGQHLVVSDTIIEDIPTQTHRPRPWAPGNNPKTALKAYLEETDRFEDARYINSKLLATFNPEGYLKCIKK